MTGRRVLVVADSFYPNVGGAERVIAESSEALQRRGHRVWIVAGSIDSRRLTVDERATIPVVRFPLCSRNTLFLNAGGIYNAQRAVRWTLKAKGPFDVVHGHHLLAPTALSVCRPARRLPRISTFHGPADQEFVETHQARVFGSGSLRGALDPAFVRLYARWLRMLQGRVIRSGPCVVLGKFAAGLLAEVVSGYPQDRVRVIPGGVDLGRFRPAENRGAVRSALGLPADGPLLLTARRLVPGMGIERLIDAVAEVRSRHPGVHLVVAGSGPIAGALAERVARRDLQGVVTFAGMLGDDRLVRFYQAADLFVLASVLRESFGLVTLESLACGTPVFTTPGGSVDVVRPLGEEFIAAEASSEALAAGITDVLDRWGDAPELRARCRAHVAQHYSWDLAASRLTAVYDEVTRI